MQSKEQKTNRSGCNNKLMYLFYSLFFAIMIIIAILIFASQSSSENAGFNL